jgi:hypothetical protein
MSNCPSSQVGSTSIWYFLTFRLQFPFGILWDYKSILVWTLLATSQAAGPGLESILQSQYPLFPDLCLFFWEDFPDLCQIKGVTDGYKPEAHQQGLQADVLARLKHDTAWLVPCSWWLGLMGGPCLGSSLGTACWPSTTRLAERPPRSTPATSNSCMYT